MYEANSCLALSPARAEIGIPIRTFWGFIAWPVKPVEERWIGKMGRIAIILSHSLTHGGCSEGTIDVQRVCWAAKLEEHHALLTISDTIAIAV